MSRLASRLAWTATCVLLVAGVLAALTVPAGSADPREQLRRTLAFLREHPTASYTATFVEEFGNVDEEGIGENTTMRTREEGVVSLPDRSRSRTFDSDYYSDTIIVPTGAYSREGETLQELDAAAWTYFEWSDASEAMQNAPATFGTDEAMALVASEVMGSLGSPVHLVAALRRLDDVERVSARTIRGRIDPRALMPETIAEAIPREVFDQITFTVELTTGSGARLDRLRLEMVNHDEEEGDTKSTADLTFTRWGEPVELAVPPSSTLDRTPSIDEDDVRAFTRPQPYVPAQIPAGWHLEWANVSEQDDEFESCRTLDIGYAGPGHGGMLSVTISDTSCPYNDTEMTEGVVDEARGPLFRSSDGAAYRSVYVNHRGTRVELESTDFDAAALLSMAKNVVAFELDCQPIELTPLPPEGA